MFIIIYNYVHKILYVRQDEKLLKICARSCNTNLHVHSFCIAKPVLLRVIKERLLKVYERA